MSERTIYNMALNKPIKCVFDTDAGTDDAQAILMALASPLVEMVGFTVVHGNTDMRQAAVNVLRLLQLTGCTQVCGYSETQNEAKYKERSEG